MGEVSILLGDGKGGFGAPTDFAAGDGSYSIVVGDFNGDGGQDLAVANYWGNDVSILLNVLSVSIGDVTVSEGNAGTVNAYFPVSLSGPSTETVTVTFRTANGTAAAGTDYVATSGTLTFNPGETRTMIAVVVNGNRLHEANETFFVNLSNPVNIAIADAQGVGTISNDDPLTSVSISPRDFNGDGNGDILWRHDSGAVAVWLMNGLNIQSSAVVGTPGNDWHIAAE